MLRFEPATITPLYAAAGLLLTMTAVTATMTSNQQPAGRGGAAYRRSGR
ncbi:hypothetical protein ACIBCO_00095 [Streptomyces violascens]